MARLIPAALALLLPLAGSAQQNEQDRHFQLAGVCARCHVISVVEWGMASHSRNGTDCLACHGASKGHVSDERNNVKPDRTARGAAIATQCLECHNQGCAATAERTSCQQCHHSHALIDPSKAPVVRPMPFDPAALQKARAAKHEAEADRLSRLPREVRTAGLGITLLLIPGGEFEMGSEKFAAARPVHSVRVAPFYLAKHEVTQADWKAVMGANPSAHPGDSLPVEQVSWEDAQAFLKKLNERAPGGGFRLPTEAEWEFAARAGAADPLDAQAWFGAPENESAPHPAGTKQPDKLGLHDMRGNVWEWCSSLAGPYPYSAADGRESLAAPGLRVLRGGGYADPADLLDPGLRHFERPNRRLPWNGLRVARSIP